MSKETYENQIKDSDTIFSAISTSDARDYEEAKRMVINFYYFDPTISRAGISHALKRLEKFYKERKHDQAAL